MRKWFTFALEPRRPGTEALYYRAAGFRRDGAALSALRAGASLSFDTFFHMLPLRKLRTYTVVTTLRFRVQSAFPARLAEGRRNAAASASAAPPENAALEVWIAGEGWERLFQKYPLAPGVCAWDVPLAELPEGAEALFLRLSGCPAGFVLREISLLSDGTPAAQSVPAPDAVAIVICTFRRETQVRRNVEYLLSRMGTLPLHIYLADNGRTIPPDSFHDARVSVLPGDNTGGSGGFERGMRAAVQTGRFSRLLLMDDDIAFDFAALEKLCGFLRVLKPEYTPVSVSGAMLEWERPCVQFESGARFSPNGMEAFGRGLDLRARENLLKNEREKDANYGAWWFFCLSVRPCLQGQYPAPFFFQYDDVEYALRCKLRVVTLNGVAVWHQGMGRRSPTREYFTTRNALFTAKWHPAQAPPPFRIARWRLTDAFRRGQPAMARAVLTAYADFLQGDAFLRTVNLPEKLAELARLDRAYALENPPEQTGQESRQKTPPKWKSLPALLRAVAALSVMALRNRLRAIAHAPRFTAEKS